jgi:hypothetical protein
MPEPHWTVADDGDLMYGDGQSAPAGLLTPGRLLRGLLNDEAWAALVDVVRAARAQHPALGQIVDCPGVPAWVHVRGDKLDPLVAAARLADDMAAVIRRLDASWTPDPRGGQWFIFDSDTPAEPMTPGEVAALHHARQQEPT